MRFDILVQVVREGFIWWFKNEGGITGEHEGEPVWVILFEALEEHSTGWLEAVRIARGG